MHAELERAYALGDHGTASLLAAHIVSGQLVVDDACAARARAILEQTKPDRFLSLIGALGLGLMTWLVYNYVL